MRLYHILLSVVGVIVIFFVVSSMSFSGRYAEGDPLSFVNLSYLMTSKIMLLKHGAPVGGYWTAGWPSFTLQLSASSLSYGGQAKIIEDEFSPFSLLLPGLISFPFTLMLSDELAQDEEDAEDYDLEAIQNRTRLRDDDDDDAATLVGIRRDHEAVSGDNVVFEIGDEDEDEEDGSKKRKVNNRLSGENHRDTDERQGLVG